MSRRSGRKAAAAVNVASTVRELATDETDVDRVAGGGRVNGENASAGGIPEPDPPVSEQKLTDSCFGQSNEPADPVPEGPMSRTIIGDGDADYEYMMKETMTIIDELDDDTIISG
ncbi:hypothetical protein pipiens_001472 [Culex pipiens pipiens]|uniref:Uncharacterized protein n=1 Tax=Culex pipiens pipiens TaxID=38569 RepID=A0ABD1CRX3_CULPP